MSAQSMLNMLNNADRELEASLCTVLQSVRGTKQFWFKRIKGDVDCMIRYDKRVWLSHILLHF